MPSRYSYYPLPQETADAGGDWPYQRGACLGSWARRPTWPGYSCWTTLLGLLSGNKWWHLLIDSYAISELVHFVQGGLDQHTGTRCPTRRAISGTVPYSGWCASWASQDLTLFLALQTRIGRHSAPQLKQLLSPTSSSCFLQPHANVVVLQAPPAALPGSWLVSASAQACSHHSLWSTTKMMGAVYS